MTKKDMIKELIKTWVKSSKTDYIKQQRYINHDRVENYLDRTYAKGGIELIYNKVFYGNCDINYIIAHFTNSKFIF